jgi:hypothetical protein
VEVFEGSAAAADGAGVVEEGSAPGSPLGAVDVGLVVALVDGESHGARVGA